LTIALTKEGVAGALMIYCQSPDRIEAPRHWNDANIEIELDARLFRVVDRIARVSISECAVGLKEYTTNDWWQQAYG
jgi:hypothetical protein